MPPPRKPKHRRRGPQHSAPPGKGLKHQRAALPNRRQVSPSKPPGGRLPPNSPRPTQSKSRRSKRRSFSSIVLGAVIGLALGAGALGALTWSSGCGSQTPQRDRQTTAGGNEATGLGLPPPPPPPGSLQPDRTTDTTSEGDVVDAGAPDAPYDGPWLGALAHRTPVYAASRFSRRWIGYIRRGGKVPVVDKPITTPSCRKGWYPLVAGGYVCGKYATTNMKDPAIRLGVKAPDLEALLPYKYAYNTAHGTPLYRSVPSKEEMYKYEPYLKNKKKKSKKAREKAKAAAKAAAEKADQPRPISPAAKDAGPAKSKPHRDAGVTTRTVKTDDARTGVSDGGAPASAAVGDGGASTQPEPVDAGPPTPWWQADAGKQVNVTLAELDERDGTLAKRMVKGFFIAVDKTFGWNNRFWYKTTEGLVAPADRMIIPATPALKGMEMPEGVRQVGFVRRARAHKYEFSKEKNKPKRLGRLKRFTAVGLTGKTRLYKRIRYRETVEGWWLRETDGTYTDPGDPPENLLPSERWLDINLSRKTLVAFEGDKPVYAALISPGKRSQIKKRDHRTKTGTFRIREKHITTPMDGDGVADDLPYSIEDVPYVQYYDGSYALHGAFWHHNFGREQSHGCVNLAPTDAKYLFWWTSPRLPKGWHAVWATSKNPGTRVVIHE